MGLLTPYPDSVCTMVKQHSDPGTIFTDHARFVQSLGVVLVLQGHSEPSVDAGLFTYVTVGCSLCNYFSLPHTYYMVCWDRSII